MILRAKYAPCAFPGEIRRGEKLTLVGEVQVATVAAIAAILSAVGTRALTSAPRVSLLGLRGPPSCIYSCRYR